MKNKMIGKCRICGADYSCYMFSRRSKIKRYMLENDVCADCASWLTREKDPNARELIAGGIAYNVYPFVRDVNAGDFLGNMGKPVFFIDKETLTSIGSNDTWKIGPVPPAMNIEDNAVVTDFKNYKALKEGVFECHGKACLDRYTCAFYFVEQEENGKPVNRIPRGWVDGSENCPTYLNINDANKIIMEWRRKRLLAKRG